MTTTTTTPTATIGWGRRLLSWLPLAALVLAIAAAVLLVAGPLGWRAGWWHFRTAFTYLMPYAAYCGLAAVAVAVIALVFTRRQIAVAIAALVVGGAIAYVPWSYGQMRGTTPPIHDITTDMQNPPEFKAVLPLREAEKANPVAYEGAKVSDEQKKAYPDIAPATLDVPPKDAFPRALKAAEQRGWTIVASDPAAGRIEAYERSRWFGFTDDVVIRVAAADRGSRVDVRSVSRWGRNDFGVNAARVRGYLAALRGP
jgi:uncharacterized protein (DUF1499 family)